MNEKKGLTFARGLRSILRHDPDKIMVGEIRDPETADIAIQSALTGHLVFTTVHANNVIDVLGRFLNMKIEPYNFVSALNCVQAQRLVRTICAHCKREVRASRELLVESGLDPQRYADVPFYEGAGCIECGGTGYKGRTAICELLDVTDSIRELILARRSSADIKRAAREEGMIFLRESAVNKALGGQDDPPGDQQGHLRGGGVTAPRRGWGARCGRRDAGSRARWSIRPCRWWRSRCGRGRSPRSAWPARAGDCPSGPPRPVDLPEGVLEVSLARPNLVDPDAFRARCGPCSSGWAPSPAGRSRSSSRPRGAAALVPAAGLRGRRRSGGARPLPAAQGAALVRRAGGPAGLGPAPGGPGAGGGGARRDGQRVRGRARPRSATTPGSWSPPSLALLARRGDGPGDRLLVNWDLGYVSFVLWRAAQPLLLRTLPRDVGRDSVRRQPAQTLQLPPRAARGAGARRSRPALGRAARRRGGALLGASLGAPPRPLRPWAALGITEDGAAAQAVAGAAACVLRRAA